MDSDRCLHDDILDRNDDLILKHIFSHTDAEQGNVNTDIQSELIAHILTDRIDGENIITGYLFIHRGHFSLVSNENLTKISP